jgi:aminoglycoside phosphotransferase (APT) family kinase protein
MSNTAGHALAEARIPGFSVEDARQAAAALLGSPVGDAAPVPSAAENQVFRIRCDDLVAYLKVADQADLQRELGVLQLLGRAGVLAPVVEAADPDGIRTGAPCALLRDVGGSPLSHSSPELTAAGPLLRQVHEIALDGYGYLATRETDLCGEDGSWHHTIQRRIQGLEPIAEARLVDPGLLSRAVEIVNDSLPRLASPRPGRLLHGDFHPRHVYGRDGQVSGIIDWADASCGDPLYDFGRIMHSGILAGGMQRGIEVVRQMRQTYGTAPWLQADPTESLLSYAAVFTLAAMQSEYAAGSPWPPWWPAQAAALAVIVGELRPA